MVARAKPALLLSPLLLPSSFCLFAALAAAVCFFGSSRRFGFLGVLLVLAMVDGEAVRMAGVAGAIVSIWTTVSSGKTV